jgi:folate-binding protein YgfZ
MAAHDNDAMNSRFPSPAAWHGMVRLTDWGVIRAHGDDARSFLHGQLTQDILHLPAGRARLAGYCSAKGRLLASFVVWADPAGTDVLLACSADLLPQVLRRLRMYVLRAKCRLDDDSESLPVHGLVGPAVPDGAPWSLTPQQGAVCIRLPDAAGLARALWVGPAPAAAEPLPLPAWQWLEVHSGVPRICAATSEQFVPQMVNLEALDGVNFQKGCYPGQEVVARSQYRGTLKRRAYLAETDAVLTPGMEVFDAAEPEQPAGTVVLAADAPGQAPVSLLSLKTASVQGRLFGGRPDGVPLRLQPLPYPLPAEPA